MTSHYITFKVTHGHNQGDTLTLDVGVCRLIGRHLSDDETFFMDQHGHRMLEEETRNLLSTHFEINSTDIEPKAMLINDNMSFKRGPDIIFADTAISRAHAMLFHSTTNIGVVDLASTNGTYVNNQSITSAVLHDGDVLTIGDSKLKLLIRRD